ncbi:MAG TPA: ribosome-associated translation inhibitor RaiA [Candidatus Saccharimonadales bacterium]
MVERMELKGVHLNIDDNLRKYVQRKLGRLDRFMSKRTQQSAHMEVTLKESKVKGGKQCHCDVALHLPNANIVIKESTVNMFAAVDIAEAKLKMQLKKYKDTHEQGKLRRKLFARRRNRLADIVVPEV